MLKKLLSGLLLALTILVGAVEAPQLHASWLRHNAVDRIYEVLEPGMTAGGTGFAVKGDSGTSYILTNSHICDRALNTDTKDLMVVKATSGKTWKRHILEISDTSDLCLIEGLPGVEGMDLASLSPGVGTKVWMMGHPGLGPTALVSGEVTAAQDVKYIEYYMSTGNDGVDAFLSFLGVKFGKGDCSAKKNSIEKEPLAKNLDLRMCVVTIKNATQTTMPTYGGNSGSPVVNVLGSVVGIMFASDNTKYWGAAVSLDDLKDLLKDY